MLCHNIEHQSQSILRSALFTRSTTHVIQLISLSKVFVSKTKGLEIADNFADPCPKEGGNFVDKISARNGMRTIWSSSRDQVHL